MRTRADFKKKMLKTVPGQKGNTGFVHEVPEGSPFTLKKNSLGGGFSSSEKAFLCSNRRASFLPGGPCPSVHSAGKVLKHQEGREEEGGTF